MAGNGIRISDFSAAAAADALIGLRNGSGMQIPIELLIQIVLGRIGPTYATLADLEADLAWGAGSVGAVWGDPDDGNKGTYLKIGAAGAGSWVRIGDLPINQATSAVLAAKADLTRLVGLETLTSELSVGLNRRGSWDAGSGAFPAAAARNDAYIVNGAGTVDGESFAPGDWLIAIAASPATDTYAGNWVRDPRTEIVPAVYESVAALSGTAEPARGLDAIWAAADDRYSELDPAAIDPTLETLGGVKLRAQLGSPIVARQWAVVAEGTPTTDQTEALYACVSEVANRGGGPVTLPPDGSIGIAGALFVPECVDLVGVSGIQMSYGTAGSGARIKALSAAAKIVFRGRGGLTERVTFDGSNLAGVSDTAGFVELEGATGAAGGAQRTFAAMKIVDCAGDGLWLRGAQNHLFLGLDIEGTRGHGVVLAAGAGGNCFVRPEISNNTLFGIVNRGGSGSDPYGGVTQHNRFIHPILERPDPDNPLTGQCAGKVISEAGSGILYLDSAILVATGTVVANAAAGLAQDALLQILGGSVVLLGTCRLQQSTSSSTSAPACIRIEAGTLVTNHYTILQGAGDGTLGPGIVYNGGAVLPNGNLFFNNIVNRWAGSVSPTSVFAQSLPAYFKGETGQDLLRMSQQGDSNPRLKIGSTGTISLGDGTNATDTSIYRGAAGRLQSAGSLVVSGGLGPTANQIWLSGSGSPEGVVTAGAGAFYSNTTGGAGTSVFMKRTTSGNTGWFAVA